MLASDLTALCRFTNEYFVVPEYHILELHKDHVVLTDLNDNVVEPEFLSVDWELNSAGKNGYPFYMEKNLCGSMRNSHACGTCGTGSGKIYRSCADGRRTCIRVYVFRSGH